MERQKSAFIALSLDDQHLLLRAHSAARSATAWFIVPFPRGAAVRTKSGKIFDGFQVQSSPGIPGDSREAIDAAIEKARQENEKITCVAAIGYTREITIPGPSLDALWSASSGNKEMVILVAAQNLDTVYMETLETLFPFPPPLKTAAHRT